MGQGDGPTRRRAAAARRVHAITPQPLPPCMGPRPAPPQQQQRTRGAVPAEEQHGDGHVVAAAARQRLHRQPLRAHGWLLDCVLHQRNRLLVAAGREGRGAGKQGVRVQAVFLLPRCGSCRCKTGRKAAAPQARQCRPQHCAPDAVPQAVGGDHHKRVARLQRQLRRLGLRAHALALQVGVANRPAAEGREEGMRGRLVARHGRCGQRHSNRIREPQPALLMHLHLHPQAPQPHPQAHRVTCRPAPPTRQLPARTLQAPPAAATRARSAGQSAVWSRVRGTACGHAAGSGRRSNGRA